MKSIALTGLAMTLAVSGCNIEVGYPAGDKPFISFNRLDMDDNKATEAQEDNRRDVKDGEEKTDAERERDREPPVGSIHTRQTTYPFAKSLEGRAEAGDLLKNPLPLTAENLEVGQAKYNTYCATCHGLDGLGPASKSRSAATDRGVPIGNNLTDARVYGLSKNRPGEIFHVITRGNIVMGSYAGQLEPLERWAVVHYVRTLGTVQNPPSAVK